MTTFESMVWLSGGTAATRLPGTGTPAGVAAASAMIVGATAGSL
jgi:hypothetical protein